MPFKFDKTEQYGQYAQVILDINCRWDPSAIYHIVGYTEMNEEVIILSKKVLQRNIDKYIPKEFHKLMEWIVHGPGEITDPIVAKCGTVGWKYTPAKRKKLPEKDQCGE